MQFLEYGEKTVMWCGIVNLICFDSDNLEI